MRERLTPIEARNDGHRPMLVGIVYETKGKTPKNGQGGTGPEDSSKKMTPKELEEFLKRQRRNTRNRGHRSKKDGRPKVMNRLKKS